MTRKDWVSAEIDRVYPDPESQIRQSVIALMSTWQRMVVFGLKSAAERQEVIEAFSALAAQKAIPDPARTRSESVSKSRVWAPANMYYRMSSIARVRPDYDDSDDGWKVNAREGRIIGVRGGYMIIRFDNEVEGAPLEFRGRPADIQVDISHLENRGNA